MPDKPVVDFDHQGPAYAADNATALRHLVDECPMAWSEHHGGFWVATGHDAVATIARDDDTFSSHHSLDPGSPFGGIIIPPAPIVSGMIEMDPPDFLELRRLLNAAFAPAAVARLQDDIERYTSEAIDRFIESGSCDLVLDLASPVPAIMTMQILGLPTDEWETFATPAHEIAYVPQTNPHFEEVLVDLLGILGRIGEMIPRLRADPGEDVLSLLCTATFKGAPLSEELILGMASLIITGGVDTTTSLTAQALLHLHRHPDDRALLVAEPDRRMLACEEFLRYFSPVQGLARTVTCPVVVEGQQLAPHDRVFMSWAGANRDPAVFDRPDEIILDRFPNRHAAFGLGIHRCIGSNLARAQYHAMVDAVLDRLPDYVVDESRVERYESIAQANGFVCMPATFTPGSKAT